MRVKVFTAIGRGKEMALEEELNKFLFLDPNRKIHFTNTAASSSSSNVSGISEPVIVVTIWHD